MIFTEGEVQLEASPRIPKYFSTTSTNEFGSFRHMHCLITYECITPEIIQFSKDRISSFSSLKLLENIENSEESHVSYVPVALCLVTSSSYIDLFREILESLYSFLIDIRLTKVESNSLIASTEFMRMASMLINDTIIPPYDIKISINIGGNKVEIPVEYSTGLPHVESCIAVLTDLIDIRNIIEL